MGFFLFCPPLLVILFQISYIYFLWSLKKKHGCFSQSCLNNSIYNITFNMLKRDIKMYWRQQRVRQLIWYECKLNELILCKIQFKYLSYDRYDSRFHDNIMNFSEGYWNILHHISYVIHLCLLLIFCKNIETSWNFHVVFYPFQGWFQKYYYLVSFGIRV